MTGEGEWKTRKHGAFFRRQWRKVHLGIDAEMLDIRAIEVTTECLRRCADPAGSAGANPLSSTFRIFWGR